MNCSISLFSVQYENSQYGLRAPDFVKCTALQVLFGMPQPTLSATFATLCSKTYCRTEIIKLDCFNTRTKVNTLQQERHCTYNVTLKRVRVTIVAVAKQ